MRTPLICIACLMYIHGSGQEPTPFEKKLGEQTCSCLEEARRRGPITDSVLEGCLQVGFMQDTTAIMDEMLKVYGDTTEEHAQEFGQTVTLKVMANMIPTCRPYFQYMDSVRYADYVLTNADSMKLAIRNGENIPAPERTPEDHAGLIYAYIVTREFDKAITELDILISNSPEDPDLLTSKGFIREMQGDYDDAISLYRKASTFAGKDSMKIFIAIAQRKKAGY